MKDDSEKTVQSPEQMSDHLRVTYVPTYLLAAAAALLLVAFIVWGILGNVSDKAYYSGVVFPVQGTTDITLPNNGIVRSMLVRTKTDNEPFEAFGPIVSVIEGNASGAQPLRTQLVAYADNEAQRDLRIGMEAQVWPADEKRDEIGYVHGRITQVVRYPANAADVRQRLKSDVLAQRLLGDGQKVVYEVIIDLQRDPSDPTSYDWSFGQPDDVSMDFGTYCSVLTETRRLSMFQYLFEASRTHFRNLKLKFE